MGGISGSSHAKNGKASGGGDHKREHCGHPEKEIVGCGHPEKEIVVPKIGGLFQQAKIRREGGKGEEEERERGGGVYL